MNQKSSENRTTEQPDKAGLPRWLVLLIALIFWVILLPRVHAGIPWALSLLTPRFGWIDDHPAIWNLLGLIPMRVQPSC